MKGPALAWDGGIAIVSYGLVQALPGIQARGQII